MTAAPSSRRERRGNRKKRRTVVWVIGGLALLLVLCVAWVGIRGLMAKNELEAAVPLASTLKDQVLAQETNKISSTAALLDDHAGAAASLTSDPIWRLAEFTPWAGPNLTAFRELAAVIDDLSTDAVGPLTELATSIEVADFKPVDGVLDLQPLIDARPVVERAATAVESAQKSMADIDTRATIGPVRNARTQLDDQLTAIAGPVDAIRTATVLVPDMLGASGPRDFLLLFQNPAELRASGGIPGALALMRTESGSIDLLQQAAATDFPRYDSPVLPLNDSTRSLYGDFTGEWMQNVNLTPQFPVTAALAREMWKLEFGTEVSGVLSIDPVALSYILEATGPITLATGDVLSAENAVTLLLKDAYLRYSEPIQQDLFFAAAASAVFDTVASGNLDPVKLIDALARSGSERRINLWSAVEAEQAELAETTLAGELPEKTGDVQPFGVYLNDGTEAKMGYYLDVAVADGQVTCRQDGRPNYGVTVTLTNNAPADAAESLPEYVTGSSSGVPQGSIKTVVNVYGTPELQNYGVARDGAVVPYRPAIDSGYQVSQIEVELAPGESTTLEFGFLGDAPFDSEVVTEQTPVIYRHETQQLTLSCESPLW
ncbi:hypothetical protein IWX78_000017 [Mycetocola sp. CAN_C7]|uniref:DUF4012 domain-containing protein n=1 Tax=Mycetocola sp. CAN_C7 TaxID=2787724 RepID=UPI0018C9C696